ncbi:MAG TPA: SDR family NAD(P)-dependent oxidoreductase [Azospirillaceae bacterium]|nr:SDR family NAD(P)-dependent oxidoreductase [Azospirillaceae bacterium]
MTIVTRKAALVTGAGHGVGRLIALDLGAHGWNVGVHYFSDKAEADEVVAAIRREGGQAEAIQANLAREEETVALVPEAVDRLGPLTLLVNHEASLEPDTAKTATRDTWDRHLETNLRAPFVLTQAFADQLPRGMGVAAGDGGCVVNILDQRAPTLAPRFLSYAVSKAGLLALTRVLAMALAPRVRVNGIGPGPFSRTVGHDDAAAGRPVPLRRGVGEEEIAAALRFIVETPSLTGQILTLDAGEHMGWVQPAAHRAES